MQASMKLAGLVPQLKSRGGEDSSLEDQGAAFQTGEDDNRRSSGQKELICSEVVRGGSRTGEKLGMNRGGGDPGGCRIRSHWKPSSL